MLLGDDSTLKDLDTLFGTFLDLDVHTDGAADLDHGGFALDVLSVKDIDQIAH